MAPSTSGDETRTSAVRSTQRKGAINLANFNWQIADQLRGVYKPYQYGDVILPMTILRRLDALMAGTRDTMRTLAAKNDKPDVLARLVRKQTGLGFYNTSPFDFQRLLADADGLKDNLIDYITGSHQTSTYSPSSSSRTRSQPLRTTIACTSSCRSSPRSTFTRPTCRTPRWATCSNT